MNCVFCDIVAANDQDPVFENDQMFAIKNIAPEAPVHLLLIPKRHIEGLRELEDSLEEFFEQAQMLGDTYAPEGYRLALNTGNQKEVKHLHLHIAGGQPLGRIAEGVTN